MKQIIIRKEVTPALASRVSLLGCKSYTISIPSLETADALLKTAVDETAPIASLLGEYRKFAEGGDSSLFARMYQISETSGLVIDQASHSVKVDGQEASLTPKEFDLLVFLATNRGIALSRERILQKVWNYDYFGEDRTVDTHIKMLRSHLGRYRDAIVTVWGIGYKFDPDAVK